MVKRAWVERKHSLSYRFHKYLFVVGSSIIVSMTSSATLKLEKVLKLCEQRNLFSIVRTGNVVHHVNYGPVGTQFQNYILKEWNQAILSHGATTIFPLSCPTFYFSQIRQSLLPGMLQQYLSGVKLVGERLPFGFAQSGTCFLKADENNTHEGIFQPRRWKPEEFTSLTIVFFCPPKSSMDWLNFWCKQRLSWWKKFSCFLSDFSATEIGEAEPGLQSADLLYQAPWGDLHLEKVCNLGSQPLEELSKETNQNYMARDGRKLVLPHVITCETNLDTAILTFLLDAFEEKEKGIVLRLHRRLAPYKVAIAIGGVPAAVASKLRDLAQHTLVNINEVGITVLPNPDLYTFASLESQFSRFDELGLPYSVLLNEGALQTGIVGLRSRDTTRKEQVHVTEVKATLLRYLQMPQPST